MLIPIKQDSANGELGVSGEFGVRERAAAERFKRHLLTDPQYVPEGLGTVPLFESLVAAFYLVPEGRIAGLMWIYFGMEGLRRSLFVTTFRVPLAWANPLALATSIQGGRVDQATIHEAVKSGRFEIEIEEALVGKGVEADPASIGEAILRDMPLVGSADLEALSKQRFSPFISFKPASQGLSDEISGRSHEQGDNGPSRARVAANSRGKESVEQAVVTLPAAKAGISESAGGSKTMRSQPEGKAARRWDKLAYLLIGSVLGGLVVGILRTPDGTSDREVLNRIDLLQSHLAGLAQDISQIKDRVQALDTSRERPGPRPAPPVLYVVKDKDVWLRSEPRGGKTDLLPIGQEVEVKNLPPDAAWGEVETVIAGQQKRGFVFMAGFERKPK